MTVNYDHVNGNITMRIADTGSYVEFYILTDQYTYNNDQNWSYTANGSTVSSTTGDIAKGTWNYMGHVNVTSSQTVSFHVTDEGLGFSSYTYSVAISRDTVPPAPKAPILTVRSSTTIELDWGGSNGDGGAAIDSYQYTASKYNTIPSTTVPYSANYQWTGLTPGTKYYFWARSHNSVGWSAWSPVSSATTWDVPDAPDLPVISSITNTTAYVVFTDNSNNGSSIDDRQITYGKNSSGVQTTVSSDGSTTITGLTPGTTYYVWARTHNSVGWSSWGPRASFTTEDVPDAPSAPTISSVTQTTARAVFTDNSNNGSTITGHQLGWGTSSSAPTTTVSSDTDQVLTGLPAGKQLYFFARAQNAYGWGPWSAAKGARTIAGAWVLQGTTWKPAIPWVRVNGVWKVAKPWVKIAGAWKGTTS